MLSKDHTASPVVTSSASTRHDVVKRISSTSWRLCASATDTLMASTFDGVEAPRHLGTTTCMYKGHGRFEGRFKELERWVENSSNSRLALLMVCLQIQSHCDCQNIPTTEGRSSTYYFSTLRSPWVLKAWVTGLDLQHVCHAGPTLFPLKVKSHERKSLLTFEAMETKLKQWWFVPSWGDHYIISNDGYALSERSYRHVRKFRKFILRSCSLRIIDSFYKEFTDRFWIARQSRTIFEINQKRFWSIRQILW